jgi:hypothetical protein
MQAHIDENQVAAVAAEEERTSFWSSSAIDLLLIAPAYH